MRLAGASLPSRGDGLEGGGWPRAQEKGGEELEGEHRLALLDPSRFLPLGLPSPKCSDKGAGLSWAGCGLEEGGEGGLLKGNGLLSGTFKNLRGPLLPSSHGSLPTALVQEHLVQISQRL